MMANEEHVRILREGVEVWNRWRLANPDIRPDLSHEDLNGAVLVRIALDFADLRGANLRNADLSLTEARYCVFDEAQMEESRLSRSNLTGASFSKANLRMTRIARAWLLGSNLQEADLQGASLRGAAIFGISLREANLLESDLREASFYSVEFGGTDLTRATVGFTQFSNCDFSSAIGINTMIHSAPSSIGVDTVFRSAGAIPVEFFRGSGTPEVFIEYTQSLIEKPIRFYSCFIGYSSQDYPLAQRLHADLQQKGVRCWIAPEDLKIGDRLRPAIDESIRRHDKLLLILSEHSVTSFWVEHEVETALSRERRFGKTVLFPICVDDSVMKIETGWPALIRNTRHIGDFMQWKNHDAYQVAFERLLRDLKAEGG